MPVTTVSLTESRFFGRLVFKQAFFNKQIFNKPFFYKQLLGLLVSLSCLVAGGAQAAESKAIYVAREKPAVIVYHNQADYLQSGYQQNGYQQRHYEQNNYRVINRSRGYEPPPLISGTIRGNRASAQFNYHGSSTTTINNSVQIIPPQNGSVGDISYSQDQYNIYPNNPYPRYQHPRKRYYPQTVVQVIDDPQATEQRSKQWTDKSDFYP